MVKTVDTFFLAHAHIRFTSGVKPEQPEVNNGSFILCVYIDKKADHVRMIK